MNYPLRRLWDQVVPFLAMGIFIVVLAVGVILVFHLLLWGMLLGIILFVVNWVKHKLTLKRPTVTYDDSGDGRLG